MRRPLFLVAAFGLTAATALAQGVAPGGGIGNSTGIGSGWGGVIGGTGPSYPNGTTAPATPQAIPPGGLPPVGYIDRTPAPPSQVPSAATTRSPYPEQADPYYPSSSRRNTAAVKNSTGKAAAAGAAEAATMAR